ncbi:MAG TPA: hypothetical protein VM841_06785 [Actinomycetota bacterium]|nr:hypothetical protein [Actinomycetota bacterium]
MNGRLRSAAWLYAAGLALHTADHLRRGADVITPQVKMIGAISTVAGGIAIALVLVRDRRGSTAAAWTGLPVAIGIAAVHLLPRWSAFSDAFVGASAVGVNALSWFAVIVEIAGAAAFGLAGIHARRPRLAG